MTSTPEQSFWAWFSSRQMAFFHLESDQEALFDELSDKLGELDENLCFEFSPVLEDGYREFTISADGVAESFPTVIRLVESAPQLANWRIVGFRQPTPDFSTIDYGGLRLSLDDVFFRYAVEPDTTVNLELNVRGYEESALWINTLYLVLDAVIGEYDTAMHIGWISRVPLSESQLEGLFSITELPMVIQQVKAVG